MTHESIQSLWAEAAAVLRETKNLYVIGYPLPKSDQAMRYFLKSTLNSQAQVES